MILKSWLIISILFISFLSACTTPNINQNNKTQTPAALGQVVDKLEDKIWYVFQDMQDNYWFGSNNNGVYKYDGTTLRIFTTEDGLVDNTIRGIQGDKNGRVYFDTPDGISQYDGKTFTTLQKVPFTNDWKLTEDDLWFTNMGKANDIYRYDGETLTELTLPAVELNKTFGRLVQGLNFKGMSTSPFSVYGVDKDTKGNLWIGTITAGAFRYDGQSFLWFPEQELSTLPDGRVPGVRSLLEDKNGYMWLSNFLSKYKVIETDSIPYYEKLNGIDENEELIKDILPYFNSGLRDKNGILWMTTYGGGVWRYDGESLSNIPVYDGETEALLVSIYSDNQGVLWLGTDNVGVFRFDGEGFERVEP